MRVIGIIIASILLLVVAWLAYQAQAAPEQPVSHGEAVKVVLTEKGFAPDEIHIPVGGTIEFSTDRNMPFWPASDLHPTHSIYPEFDPKRPLAPSETWSFTFERKGAWNFHDHLRSYYRGRIYVE